MSEFNHDSYCGIYCGVCEIMTAYRKGCKGRLASFWNEENVRTFHKATGIAYDGGRAFEMRCRGCKSDDLFINCRNCLIRPCAVKRNISHCIDCGEYPCEKITQMKRIEGLLPHLKGNRENLERIRIAGPEKWLSEQEERWNCPQCGENFSWYADRCSRCGIDLRKAKYGLSFLQAFLLKTGLLLSARKMSRNATK
jgi:predicted RNA-binding Zn-ribbon protein involved in translation (DUF1610 family)